MTSPAEVEDEAPPGVTCSRCGGAVHVRPPRATNPFLPRPPVRVVCIDCGLEIEVEQPDPPPSGEPPWK